MRAFDGVLFDFGHTLFNTMPPPVCTAAYLKASGTEVDDVAFGSLWEAIRKRSLQPDEMAKGRDLSAAAHRQCWLELLAPLDTLAAGLAEFTYGLECSTQGWEPYPDAIPVLAELRTRGVAIGVVSDCGWDIRDIFRSHGLDEFVGSYDLSFEHGACKPAPEIFEAACRHLSISPGRTLMVGDNALTDGGASTVGIMTLILPARNRAAEPALSCVLDLVR